MPRLYALLLLPIIALTGCSGPPQAAQEPAGASPATSEEREPRTEPEGPQTAAREPEEEGRIPEGSPYRIASAEAGGAGDRARMAVETSVGGDDALTRIGQEILALYPEYRAFYVEFRGTGAAEGEEGICFMARDAEAARALEEDLGAPPGGEYRDFPEGSPGSVSCVSTLAGAPGTMQYQGPYGG